ncbi:hypothetical protein WJX72_002518 [[Myrmecia] bisecta]|uniref:Fe-S metabolism associated domain-containing protein n=1 Tax=[Myrmecia] bisecta TaxID=41462 RepID=A0AAW1R619_9CHLO
MLALPSKLPSEVAVASPAARHQRQCCTVAQAAAVDSAQASALPEELNKIVTAFSMVPDPKIKYQQLLFYAKKLGPFAAASRTSENKVQGCVSQVWVVPEVRDGKVYWTADSDSQLTKGLAALLVQGLSGCSPEQIVKIPPEFINTMGLSQSLTPSRNNGFLNMFRLMQKKSLELLVSQGSQAPADVPSSSSSSIEAEGPVDGARGSPEASSSNGNGSRPSAAAETSNTPVQDSMRRKLTEALKPSKLVIEDQSSQHAGHVGSRMKTGYSGETHFRVSIVSAEFEGANTVKRHRLVYQLLAEELAGTVHALSLETQTPAEAK